jgi:hypothetical protein
MYMYANNNLSTTQVNTVQFDTTKTRKNGKAKARNNPVDTGLSIAGAVTAVEKTRRNQATPDGRSLWA